MLNTKKHIQNAINILVFIVCLFTITFGVKIINDTINVRNNLSSDIEKEWRAQAKRTLSDLRDNFNYDLQKNTVDPNDETSLQEWSKRNISGVLNGGETGDAFMINLGDEKFIWDGSLDCAKPEFISNGRYMKDEPEMHVDKNQANLIIDRMRLGKGTLNTFENNWWNFDGSPEYLEWVVIPSGSLGFDSEARTNGGITNPKYNKILIALGTQKDEVDSTFSKDFDNLDRAINGMEILITMCLMITVVDMILFVYLNKKRL